jgi:hypothetical protein
MVECPECGDEYTNLGQHWRWNPSHRSELTQKQLEITIGSLMGDGCIISSHKSCYLKIGMISPNYLEYLNHIFGCLGNGVTLRNTAAESAKNARDSGFSPNAKEKNCSDFYVWRTKSHPKFNGFRDWYSTGEKVWPENIELTPTVLKHWYVGDGNYSNKLGQKYIRISMANEVENTEKVSQYFVDAGLPKPSNYDIQENNYSGKCNAEWAVEGSQKLFDYMGEPLPDFEYKWPEEYR